MSVFLLIRHGSNPSIGNFIPGRMPGVHLNKEGKAQAEALAERLGRLSIDAIYSSPLERTVETARPLTGRLGLEIQIREEFAEIDIGDWAGEGFKRLTDDPLWRQYNTFRTGTRPPNGELMVEVQQRMVCEIERLRKEYPESLLAVFSHADPIKTVIAHYAGIPLDFFLRLEISLTSVSAVSINDFGPKILCMNCPGELPPFLLSLR